MAAPKGNKNAIGNNGGHPPYYSDPNELQAKIDEYFESGRNTRKMFTKDRIEYEMPIITVSGLALFLGFSSRQSLLDYAEKIEFVDIIKKAKLKIEMNYEEGLQFGQCTGQIFALKNMGWSDSSKVEVSNPDGSLNTLPKVTLNIPDEILNILKQKGK